MIRSSTLDQTGARGELRAQPARGGQAPRADGVPVRTAGQPQGALRRHHALHPPRPAGRHQAAVAAATEAAATRLGSSGGGSGRRRLGQRVTDEPKERGGARKATAKARHRLVWLACERRRMERNELDRVWLMRFLSPFGGCFVSFRFRVEQATSPRIYGVSHRRFLLFAGSCVS